MVEIDSTFKSKVSPGTPVMIYPNGKAIVEGKSGFLPGVDSAKSKLTLEEARQKKVRYQKIGRKGIRQEDEGKSFPF